MMARQCSVLNLGESFERTPGHSLALFDIPELRGLFARSLFETWPELCSTYNKWCCANNTKTIITTEPRRESMSFVHWNIGTGPYPVSQSWMWLYSIFWKIDNFAGKWNRSRIYCVRLRGWMELYMGIVLRGVEVEVQIRVMPNVVVAQHVSVFIGVVWKRKAAASAGVVVLWAREFSRLTSSVGHEGG